MRKRGLGHVEVILAFVIFMGFLLFALYFFNPIDNKRVLDSSLFYANDEIVDNVSVILESYSVVISGGSGLIGIPINPSEVGSTNVRVETYNGLNLSANYTDGYVLFDKGGEDFVTIYFSEDFVNSVDLGAGPPELLVPGQYEISSSDKRKIFSENKILALNTSYSDSYIDLKKDFNLPGRVDFGFRFDFDDGLSIVAEREIPDDLEVKAEEDQVEVIRKDGKIMFADFVVKVW